MSKISCLVILLLSASWQILLGEADIVIGVGPAWNQLLASEHFTVNNEDNKQAKTVITALDNPCAAISASYKYTFCDWLYVELDTAAVLGNRGLTILTQSVQENPFNVITDLDGSLSTKVVQVALIPGVNWCLDDQIMLILGGGFLHLRAKRFARFIRSDLRLNVDDQFTGGVFKFGPQIILTERIGVTVLYTFQIGVTNVQIYRFPLNDVTLYRFPLLMNNAAAIEGACKINDRFTASITASWAVAQNLKNGRVKQPPADAILYSNRFANLFRSQYYLMTLNLHYTF